ncbi:MAG: tetratricopeptide repeat protein [Polyangiaceae bacterium]
MRRFRTILTLLIALGACAAPLTARAQDALSTASDDDKSEARKLANKGYEHFEAGQYDKAIELFGQAEKRYPAPTILFLLGQAHERKEDFVGAQAVYKRLANMPLPDGAPPEFQEAQAKARAALDALTGRTAILKIVLKGMTADKVRVTIDDVLISPEALVQPIPQNPGSHKIVASIGEEEKGRAVFQQVTLKEGTTKQIVLVFRPGGPVSVDTDPKGGGCAACAVGGGTGGEEAPALASLLALGAVLLLRRKRAAKS